MNRDGYETEWTGPGESITGNGPLPYDCEDMLAEPYSTELTPAGEQAVIPGCERNASPRAKQLDLF